MTCWEVGAQNTTPPIDQRRADGWVGWRVKPASSGGRRRRTGDGAPYDVWEGVSVKPSLSVNQRKGRRGRRPLRWFRVGTFQRSREVQFIKPVTFHAASPVSLLYVGCTVLGAP